MSSSRKLNGFKARKRAERVFEREVTDAERDAMKALVLGRMYGMGDTTMAYRLEGALARRVSLSEVESLTRELEATYPKAEQWRRDQEADNHDDVNVTRTRCGRIRRGVDTNSQRYNTPIQGLAADVMKAIAVAVVEEIVETTEGAEINALIHDEVVLLAPEEVAKDLVNTMKETMERVGHETINGDRSPALCVPVVAKVQAVKNLGEKS